MKVVFYASHKPREILLAEAFAQGVQAAGDTFEVRYTSDYGDSDDGDELRWSGPSPDTDVACVFGPKGKSRRIIEDHRLLGKRSLYFDKGYTRSKGEAGHTEYSRIIINGADPSGYMMKMRGVTDARWRKLDIKMQPRRKDTGGHVLFCGSSQKYCDFNSLGNANEYAASVMLRLRKQTLRQLVYRPKPSDKGAKPLGTFALSPKNQKMEDALRGCYAVVTHGATSAMDAIFSGVPAITLGGCIASPVCGKDISDIDKVPWPTDEERFAWARAMAYCQWTNPEMRSGAAWSFLKPVLCDQK